ncbi:M55 family metallopeptidase [Wenxinia marina]|uniref:D-aminopeptidase DppA n=1 Tax=Wenxinia marina DSM 24838 TaxID=1123501 RepID=A0A0D0Q0U0_9RHOB|nr:M55 family metallopeptidase [Wenxinia marina]KIQ68164.1 D-aminopeptidase DppA [Wenxinia marina DSM 24838]GGL76422.1 amino acid amidase [Wenxinia marina]
MKVFISADIEGTAGITDWAEAMKDDKGYAEFRQYMTDEVVAACEGARAAGATEIVVKDAHQTGRNLIIGDLPADVRVVRGWSGHPHKMMWGIDESFDAALYTGYHNYNGSNTNPLAHTFTGALRLRLNGELASEFTINSLCAAALGVPSAFLSGDAGICAGAAEAVPGITTVAVSEGHGPGTISMTPARARAAIREGVEAALSGDLAGCLPQVPERITLDFGYPNPTSAYRASWYPGAELVGPCDARFETDDYHEALRALLFMTF